MRKLTALLCAALLMLGLCACGEQEAPAADTNATTTTEATTSTTEAPAKAPLNLTYASPFSDGIAFVRYTADGTEKSAAINSAGDLLFALPEGMEASRYQNGICVVGNLIYDKTGAVIASPETHGYDALMTGNCGGYVLAKKVAPLTLPAPSPENSTTTTAAANSTTSTEAGATTTTTNGTPITSAVDLYVGVLNNKGEWEHPLATDHPIAAAITAAAQPAENFTLLTNDVLQVYVDTAAAPQYYHFSTNTLTVDYVHYESVHYQDEDDGVYQVAENGNKKLVIQGVICEYAFKDVFIGRTTEVNEEEEIVSFVKLYDYTGKVLADITAYPSKGKYYFIANRLLILVDDDSGNRFLALLDKSGKEIIQPVPLNLRDVLYAPDEGGFVVESHSADGVVSYCHYDYAANVTVYTDVAAFNGFSEGLAAVTLTDGRLVYINQKAEIVIQ